MKYCVSSSFTEVIFSIVRKWKHPKEFGEAQWEYEIGEPPKSFNPEADLLAPSGDNVSISKTTQTFIFVAYLYKEGYSRKV